MYPYTKLGKDYGDNSTQKKCMPLQESCDVSTPVAVHRNSWRSPNLWYGFAFMLFVLAGCAVTIPREAEEYEAMTSGSCGVHLRKALERAEVYSFMGGTGQPLPTGRGAAGGARASSDKVVSCYYNTPSQPTSLLPRDIHPHLCTHINVAFARVKNNEITLEEDQLKTLQELVKLKKTNANLKILVSVGGAHNDDGFPEMVENHANRKVFIKSIKYLLRNYTLDGIDLDWEFPALHGLARNFGKRERQHFSQLLREIRTEYIREKRDYWLTVAVAAPETIVDVSYDIDQLNLYTDYVNVMTYDFHFFTKYTPMTGLNSPLYARPTEQYYLATLNINYTMHMYLSKGLDPDKIVIGIPTYGHTYTLVNSGNTAIGSPASDFGSLGCLGFVNYPDVCKYWQKFTAEVTVVMDNATKVPYLYMGHEWVSYDTPQSVMDKAKFIKDQGLRGAMIYSLNADDYEGVCTSEFGNNVKFPLSESVKNTLIDCE